MNDNTEMSESEFWVKQFKISVGGICIIAILITLSCQHSKYQIRKMVDNGASPIEAACAYEIDSHSTAAASSICTTIIHTKKTIYRGQHNE